MGWIAIFLCMLPMATTPPERSQFAPGEILVRFASGTTEQAAVSSASTTDPPNLDALQDVATRLGERVGVPLRAARLSAGGWVVLAVNSEALGSRLERLAASRANVVEAEAQYGEAGRQMGAVRPLTVRIRFDAGTPEAAAVGAKLRGAEEPQFARLSRALQEELGVPLSVEATAPQTLSLHVDVRTLTTRLVEQLIELPEVEEAQPNYVMMRMEQSP
jgi:hypothetical protein